MEQQRVIKFRAYGKTTHILYDWDWLLDSDYTSQFRLLEDDGFIMQQFTGLVDKNGKEIYEGDIVEEEVENEYGKLKISHTVEFHAGAFYPVCQQPSDTFEVIGDIHEDEIPIY